MAISWLSASRRCTVAQLLPEPPETNQVNGTLHLRGSEGEGGRWVLLLGAGCRPPPHTRTGTQPRTRCGC